MNREATNDLVDRVNIDLVFILLNSIQREAAVMQNRSKIYNILANRVDHDVDGEWNDLFIKMFDENKIRDMNFFNLNFQAQENL